MTLVPRIGGGPSAVWETGFARVQSLRSSGDARMVLESFQEAGLVVVGPKGAHGIETLLLGSTTDHLLRHCRAPLVIAKTPNRVERVLVCTDGSASAEHGVGVFANLPLAGDAAQVGVLAVATAGMYDDRAHMDDAVRRAIKTLAALDPQGIRPDTEGDVVGTILAHALMLGADLVVVGRRGLTRLRRLPVGSITHALARVAPCPILVAPPPDA